MARDVINFRIEPELNEFLNTISEKTELPKSKLINNIVEFVCGNKKLMNDFNKEISCIVEEKQLRDSLKAMTKLKFDLYVVENFMSSYFDKAVKHYRRYGSVNIDVLNYEWDFFKKNVWINVKSEYKKLLQPNYNFIERNYLDKEKIEDKIRLMFGDPTRNLRVQGGGAYGKKAITFNK